MQFPLHKSLRAPDFSLRIHFQVKGILTHVAKCLSAGQFLFLSLQLILAVIVPSGRGHF